MVDINKLLNTSSAELMAKKLDAADSNEDGKIKGAIWDLLTEYTETKSSTERGSNSEVKAMMKSIRDFIEEHFNPKNKREAETVDKSSSAAQVHKKATSTTNDTELRCEKEINEDGSYTEYYCDKNGNIVKEFSKDAKGNVTGFSEFTYYKNGSYKRDIYKADGSYGAGYEFSNDEDGNLVQMVVRGEDGKITDIEDYDYDESGKLKKTVTTYADGTYKVAYYDEKENMTSTEEFIQDANGKPIKKVTTYTGGTKEVRYE